MSSSTSFSSLEEVDIDMENSSFCDPPTQLIFHQDNKHVNNSTSTPMDVENNLLGTTLSQNESGTNESVNGFVGNEIDESREGEDFDSDSDISSCTSDDQYLSDLDDLLNEGLPEDFRGARSLKKSKDEIISLIRREGEESKKDRESPLEEGQLDESEDVEVITQVKGHINLESKEKSVTPKTKQETCNYKEIIALEEKGKNPLEVLPNGWIEVRHTSGMPLYLHRASRVCTWAKPYELRTGSARKHCIPVSGIPCFSYRRALEREKEQKARQQNTSYYLQKGHLARKHCDNSFDTSETTTVNENQNGSSIESDVIGSTTNECSLTLNSILETVSSPLCGTSNFISPARNKKNEFRDNNVLCPRELATSNICHNKFNRAIVNNKMDRKIQTNNNKIIPSSTKASENLKNLLPCARVETARENNTVNSVQPIDFRSYCEKLFKFKHLKCMRFKTWSARRKHNKELKRLHLQRPTLPDGVKLITFSVQNSGDSDGGKGNKEYIMNPQGKSSVCILHEYVQHALRMQPTYIFEELENAATPYLATVQINGVSYAVGYGSSKKQAKAAAAKATLELMIPEMKEELNGSKETQNIDSDHSQFFDQVLLDDPRITKMCANVSEPSPYALLLTCVQRNFGQSASSSIKFNMVSSSNQSNKFRMETGEYSVEVAAANKREGKQLASQALLAKIHPQIKNFSSFLRLYGNGSIKSVKEKKQEEQQITTLQSKASANSPNYAILTKLREEMMKLKAEEDKKNSLIEVEANSSCSSS